MLRIKKFNINGLGHGGERRTAQINEIFSHYSIHDLTLNWLFDDKLAKIKSVFYPLSISSHILKEIQNDLTFTRKIRETIKLDFITKGLDKFKDLENHQTIIWESTYDHQWFIPFLFKERYNKKVFSFPHNVESLVPGQHSDIFKNHQAWFFNELKYLKQCNHVFTISREEEWLLQTYGIKASYLPYYPIVKVEQELGRIRKKRQDLLFQNSFLIVGSVTNIPTYNGILSLLNFICSTSWPGDVKFIVAGFGTECFKEFEIHNFIKVLGSVSDDEFSKLLVETKLVLINQQASTGALTKIIEFLISGIPVVCNKASSRSYQSYNGVTEFSDFNELNEILVGGFNIPDLPEKPLTFYDNAIKIIETPS